MTDFNAVGFDVMVPHKEISPERMGECIKVMVSGNDAYRKWLPHVTRRRSRICRDSIVKGKHEEVLPFIPADRQAEFMADIPAIRNVETVIEELLGHHVKMIVNLAVKWSRKNNGEKSTRRSYYECGDLASEGFIAMFDALRNYNREETHLFTYLYTTVNRRMFLSLMATSPMSCFTWLEQQMLNKAIQKQSQSGKKNFADAVASGDVTDKQAELVREIRTIKVVLASCLEETVAHGGQDSFDFTSLRSGLSHDRQGQPNDAWELYDYIERAGLNECEQDVLLSSLTPFRGWQAECAVRHNITRTWVHDVLHRACNKIRRIAGLDETKSNIAKIMVDSIFE